MTGRKGSRTPKVGSCKVGTCPCADECHIFYVRLVAERGLSVRFRAKRRAWKFGCRRLSAKVNSNQKHKERAIYFILLYMRYTHLVTPGSHITPRETWRELQKEERRGEGAPCENVAEHEEQGLQGLLVIAHALLHLLATESGRELL